MEVAHARNQFEGLDRALAELRHTPLSHLKDVTYLEHVLLPKLGLNDEVLREFPEHLYPWCGTGLRSWQYPCQFARYLVYMSVRSIRNYAEIGVRYGGTFIITVEYLRRFNAISLAYAVDIEPAPILLAYAARHPEVVYDVRSSRSDETVCRLQERQWDLVMIDGDHSRDGCWSDYEHVHRNARLIALHDICSDSCPGVVDVWQDIRTATPKEHLTEFVDQYEEVADRTHGRFLGIGVVDFGR